MLVGTNERLFIQALPCDGCANGDGNARNDQEQIRCDGGGGSGGSGLLNLNLVKLGLLGVLQFGGGDSLSACRGLVVAVDRADLPCNQCQ